MLHVFISVAKTLSIYPIYPTLFLFLKNEDYIFYLFENTYRKLLFSAEYLFFLHEIWSTSTFPFLDYFDYYF